jgi:hypothetical protein
MALFCRLLLHTTNVGNIGIELSQLGDCCSIFHQLLHKSRLIRI